MNSIFQFLYKHLHWIVFFALEILCFVLLFSYNSFQGSVYLSTANNVSARVVSARSRVTSYFGLAEVNDRLATQNAALLQRVEELEALVALQQLDSLSQAEAVQRVHRTGYVITPAQIIDKSINRADNFMTLDRGTLDGVQPNMGVMSANGVVGVVYKCTEHYSLVMSLLNSKSSVSCKVQGSNDLGYLRWNGGDARYAMLHDLPRYSAVAIGDTIVTSGNSSFFPEGIMVGSVEELYPSSDGLSMTLKIALSAHFSQLERVFIMRKMDAEEMTALKESLKPKKKKK
ncbi:MAG: rod shape-determining protein MreC [Bacteroidaceae bacterium]|nr:rod shape-determining protein MreC [Bacteroidaceae bacterium]